MSASSSGGVGHPSAAQVLVDLQEVLEGQRRVEKELAGLTRAQHAVEATLDTISRSRTPHSGKSAVRMHVGNTVRSVQLPTSTYSRKFLDTSAEVAKSNGTLAYKELTSGVLSDASASPSTLTGKSGPQKSFATSGMTEKSVDLRKWSMWDAGEGSGRIDEGDSTVGAEISNMRSWAGRSVNMQKQWPRCLEINEVLEYPEADLERFVRSGESLRLFCTRSQETGDMERVVSRKWVLEPSSTIRVSFDLTSLLVLLYDLTSTPYILAWDLPLDGGIKNMMYMTLCFWALDLMLNFRTGYYKHGELEMRPKEIARRYIKTFFLPDLVIVATDLVSVLVNLISGFEPYKRAEEPFQGADLLRIAKISRILRIFGVVRLMHVSEVFKRIQDRHHGIKSSGIVISILQVLCMILWLNHVISCMWFAMGQIEFSDTGVHWLESSIATHDPCTYLESTMSYQYFTAFHWSLTQMTPGSMQVSPVNSYERTFNIICLIFGMLFFTTLISTLSAKMTHVKMKMQENEKVVSSLRKFLRDASVSPKLAIRAEKQVIERMKHTKPLTMEEVPGLRLISFALRSDLQCAMFLPHLTSNPFLCAFTQVDEVGVRKLCREAAQFLAVSPGDVLFEPGQEAKTTYILLSGEGRYLQEPGTSCVENETLEEIERGRWLCEAAIWTHWKTVGHVEAITACKLLAFDCDAFAAILSESRLLQAVAWQYARSFHKRLISSVPPKDAWPSDLELPFTYCEVLISMKESSRVFLGLVAHEIHQKNKGRKLPQEATEALDAEIRKGSCNLTIGETGEVQRVVAVLVLHLERADGRILVQMGKWFDTHAEASFALPGSKVKDGETPAEALKRFMSKEIAPFAKSVKMIRAEKKIEWKYNDRYQVRTKYIRNIHYAELDEEIRLPDMTRSNYISVGEVSALPSGSSVGERTRNLEHVDVFVLTDGSSYYLFSWVTQAEFDFLSSQSGQQALDQRMARVRVTDEAKSRCTELWASEVAEASTREIEAAESSHSDLTANNHSGISPHSGIQQQPSIVFSV